MASVDVYVWRPANIFLEDRASHEGEDGDNLKDLALLVLNQPLELPMPFYRRIWSNTIFHVAADGGANRVYDKDQLDRLARPKDHVDLSVDTIIGDLDSVTPRVQEHYREHSSAEIIEDGDQYSTDFMKAVKHIRDVSINRGFKDAGISRDSKRHLESLGAATRQPPSDIVCLGGLGGRVDQALSQIHQLYALQDATYSTGKLILVSSEAISFVLKAGKHKIKIQDSPFEQDGIKVGLGKHIGIIPIKEPSIISTQGLEWDVQDWRTEFGGQMSTSNHVRDEWAVIETSKDVLFTIHLIVSGRC